MAEYKTKFKLKKRSMPVAKAAKAKVGGDTITGAGDAPMKKRMKLKKKAGKTTYYKEGKSTANIMDERSYTDHLGKKLSKRHMEYGKLMKEMEIRKKIKRLK